MEPQPPASSRLCAVDRRDERSGQDKYSTEIVLQGFNSTFKILSSKNSQIENLQDSNVEKSSLPNDENAPANDLDDEIPF